MKRKILNLFMALAIVCSIVPWVYGADIIDSGVIDGRWEGESVAWSLDSEGTLTLSGTGDIPYDAELPWMEKYEDKVKSLVIEDGVDQDVIEHYFPKNIEKITLGKDVYDISCSDFEKLKEIVISPDNTHMTFEDRGLYNKNKTSLDGYLVTNDRTEFKVPDSVKKIGSMAFSGAYKLKKIILNDGLESIGYNAFENCTGLTELTLPASVKDVYDGFSGSSLEKINVDENSAYYSSEDGILYNKDKTELIKYPPKKAGGEFKIPGTITYVDDSAFEDCSNLENITIENSDNYTSLDGVLYAYGPSGKYYCLVYYPIGKKATVYNMPATTQKVYSQYNPYLQQINVPASNEKYKSVDGVLYLKKDDWYDGSGLAWYPSGKTTESFEIPEFVSGINICAFNNCPYLKSLVIHKSLKLINDKAVYHCGQFTDVYYKSTEKQWKKISRGGDIGDLETATIHFMNEEPEDSSFEFNSYVLAEKDEEFELSGSYENDSSSNFEAEVNNIAWESSDEEIAKVTGFSHISESNRTKASLQVKIKALKAGTAKIKGSSQSGDSVSVTVVVPESFAFDKSEYNETKGHYATLKGSLKLAEANEELLKKIMPKMNIKSSNSDLTYNESCYSGDITSGFSFKNYEIKDSGKEARFWFTVRGSGRGVVSFGNSDGRFMSDYDIKTNVNIATPMKFAMQSDSWSFPNSKESFLGRVDSKDEYRMPYSIYEKVFGRSFIEANDIETGEAFGGYCAGMSMTSALFFNGLLDWNSYNDLYENDFPTVNSYYDSINWYEPDLLSPRYYYVASNSDSEVTELIQCYQLYANYAQRYCINNASYSSFSELDKSFWTLKDGSLNEYEIKEKNNGGVYVQNMLEVFRNAVSENSPLVIALQYSDGAHAIVSRTDKMPQNMGNGWYRVYVYDPNKPYVNSDILNRISAEDPNYNLYRNPSNSVVDNGEDVYIELNPDKNMWRYYSSLTADKPGKYRGCDENEQVNLKTGDSDTVPEYFYVLYPEKYNAGSFESPSRAWLSDLEAEEPFVFVLNNSVNAEIYDKNDNLIVSVSKGFGMPKLENSYFIPFTYDESEDNEENNGLDTGMLVLPRDEYKMEFKGEKLKIWGDSNVICLSSEGKVKADINAEKNSVKLTAAENGGLNLLMSEVSSASAFNKYKLTGELKEDDTLNAEVKSGEIVTSSNTSNTIEVYHKTDETTDESYEYTINQSSTGSVGGSSVSKYTVKFETNGGSKVESVKVKKNEAVDEPNAPEKEGFEFAGWYKDAALSEKYDFSDKVTKSFTLYAAWTKKLPFTDVRENDWFYDNVIYAFENGLMNGMSENKFGPNENITRGMFVTVLYRLEGSPEVDLSFSYTDVADDKYYKDAILWAKRNAIAWGITETEFAPDENITREQIAAIMLRYARYKSYDTTVAANTNILSYTDFDDISDYAIEAMQYAVGSGLMKGKTDAALNPKDFATRAEIAAILERFIEANK